MSVNNIGGINPENISPNNHRRNDEQISVQSDNNTSYTPEQTPAHVYRQFMINNPNYEVIFNRANDNDDEMHAIFDIDREAFSELDPYSDFDEFKNFINNNNIDVYSLKDNSGEIIGYYSLEPIKDGDLYIDSIGLKPQYRNSRKGYAAIQQAWDRIETYGHKIKVLGTVSEKTYCDSVGGRVKDEINQIVENRRMLELKNT